MNRRAFLGRLASLLPVPAFVRAGSLWLPPERPRVIVPPPPEEFEKVMAALMESLNQRVEIDFLYGGTPEHSAVLTRYGHDDGPIIHEPVA